MKLWKENKISKEYELDNESILKQFSTSPYDNYEKYGHLDRRLRLFITSKDGLNSVFEEGEEYENLFTEAIGQQNQK